VLLELETVAGLHAFEAAAWLESSGHLAPSCG
jgi:hypothetical protein